MPEKIDNNLDERIESTCNHDRDNVGALESFIDESLHNTLHAKITTEIKKVLDDVITSQTPKKKTEIQIIIKRILRITRMN